MYQKKYFAISLAVLLLAAMLSGCSGVSKDMVNGYAPGEKTEIGDADFPETPYAAESVVPQEQKLIRTLEMEAETEELDVLLTALDQRMAALGGYVENRSVNNGSGNKDYRIAELTIRIPAEKLPEFAWQIRDSANVTCSRETAEDVTLQYVAVESRLKALRAEEGRLLELLAQAENMNDLLLIEQRLTDVRGELEQVTSQLRVYDNLVDYATIHLTVRQVREYTPTEEKTVWQRIGDGFGRSMRNLGTGLTEFAIFAITRFPYFIPALVIAAAVLISLKLRKKKKAQPTDSSEEKK